MDLRAVGVRLADTLAGSVGVSAIYRIHVPGSRLVVSLYWRPVPLFLFILFLGILVSSAGLRSDL